MGQLGMKTCVDNRVLARSLSTAMNIKLYLKERDNLFMMDVVSASYENFSFYANPARKSITSRILDFIKGKILHLLPVSYSLPSQDLEISICGYFVLTVGSVFLCCS